VANAVGYSYADTPNRVVAYLIDAIILAALVFLAVAAVSVVFGPAIHFSTADGEVWVDERRVIVDALVSIAVNGIYFVGSWRKLRGSPGQRLLGVQIGKPDGGVVTTRQAVFRWILLSGPFLGAAILATWLPALGPLFMLAALTWYVVLLVTTARSQRRQGLHDRYAHTAVVKATNDLAWSGPGTWENAGVR
jgi:uncharacterized RDD family membrane protein YckC